MRPVRAIFIAGAATLVLAGAAIAAKEAKMHAMSVQLPDGSIEQVRYSGDVAPQIVLAPVALTAPEDMFSAAFGPDSPFAMMDRISAQMQQQHEAMMRQAAAMVQQPATAGAPTIVANMPAGSSFHYTMVSSSGADGCTQRVEISSTGQQSQQPKVVKTSSGDCNVPKSGATTAALPNAAAAKPDTTVKPVAYEPAAPKPHTPII